MAAATLLQPVMTAKLSHRMTVIIIKASLSQSASAAAGEGARLVYSDENDTDLSRT